MDGVGSTHGGVLVLGATNVPWELDPGTYLVGSVFFFSRYPLAFPRILHVSEKRCQSLSWTFTDFGL
jgi:SpoVK/Ycf46/Vps4 family AAA+-type ATPase